MKRTLSTLIAAVAASGLTGGCGAEPRSPAATAASAVTGVASVGAPVAAVVVMDASSPAHQRLASVERDGRFTADVSGLTPPLLLKAIPASASLDAQFAIAQSAGRANVNPVTTLAVLGASGAAGTAALGTAAGLRSVAGGFDAVVSQLGDALAPLLQRYGIASPITLDDPAAIEALLRDVRFSLHGDTLLVTDAATGAVIFQGSLRDPRAGRFDPASVPSADPGSAPATPASGAPDGADLYAQRCASCHGALASSEVRGRSAAQIRATHSGKVTAAEADAVAAALAGAGSSSGGTPGSSGASPGSSSGATPGSSSGGSSGGSSGAAAIALDGVALYERYCGSCHGAIAGSSVAGKTLEQILLFMSAGLSVDKLQAIVDAVSAASAGTSTPSGAPASGGPAQGEGAAVYGQRCASCHGDLSSSGIRGSTAAAIRAKHPAKVSSAEADAVAQALSAPAAATGGAAGNCGALDGVALYNKYCAMCHGGAISRSSLQGAAVATISKFMSLGLSALQLQAIVDVLNGSSSTSCPAPGAN